MEFVAKFCCSYYVYYTNSSINCQLTGTNMQSVNMGNSTCNSSNRLACIEMCKYACTYICNCQRPCLRMTTLNPDLVFHMQNFPFTLYLRSTMFLRMCRLSKSAWKPTETAMPSSLFTSVQEATPLTLPQVNTQSCYKVVIRL